jgi:hypothetical protein
MAELDLDALRAARAEAAGERPMIRFGGEIFEGPVEIPFRFFIRLAEEDLAGAVEEILDGQADQFWAKKPSPQDLREFIYGLPRLYGLGSPGESPASGRSSSTTGSPSRPTSPATTASTSDTPPSAPLPSESDVSTPS